MAVRQLVVLAGAAGPEWKESPLLERHEFIVLVGGAGLLLASKVWHARGSASHARDRVSQQHLA
jgi:hypothetical protein